MRETSKTASKILAKILTCFFQDQQTPKCLVHQQLLPNLYEQLYPCLNMAHIQFFDMEYSLCKTQLVHSEVDRRLLLFRADKIFIHAQQDQSDEWKTKFNTSGLRQSSATVLVSLATEQVSIKKCCLKRSKGFLQIDVQSSRNIKTHGRFQFTDTFQSIWSQKT